MSATALVASNSVKSCAMPAKEKATSLSTNYQVYQLKTDRKMRVQNKKPGWVYLLINSQEAKFGATRDSAKSRQTQYNVKNNDKYRILYIVESKRPFYEENKFIWFLNDYQRYLGMEFFRREDICFFCSFFKGRLIKCG